MFGFLQKTPKTQEILRRILALRAVVTYSKIMSPRYIFEDIYKQWTSADQQYFADLLRRMNDEYCRELQASGLWKSVTPQEKALFQSTVLSWDPQQIRDASWRVEAAVPLLWALNCLQELPSFDQEADDAIFRLLVSLNLKSLPKDCRLRSQKEIEEKRSLAELWHWRSRTRQLIEDGESLPQAISEKTGFKTYDDIVRMTARLAHERGDFPRIVAEDFPVKGKAYRELNAEEWAEVRSITVERHFALNWLAGYAPRNSWDETPTNT